MNAYRHSFLWLVQYRTRGRCPSFRCKDFLVTFWIAGSHISVCLELKNLGQYWPKLHSVNWHKLSSLLYLWSTGLQGVQVFYNKQRHTTSIKTLPLLVCLTARQGRWAPSMSQLKRLWTWLDTGICNVREFGVVWVRQNKERTKFKCWECNTGLCATLCFEVFCTNLHLWESSDTKMEKRNLDVGRYYHWTGIFQ
jgi:hypothetical protein